MLTFSRPGRQRSNPFYRNNERRPTGVAAGTTGVAAGTMKGLEVKQLSLHGR